ncbi:MAG TPA: hypothetical protein VHU41_04785 [Thermoanaerobaculia bacterium]|nr:hypothetical protein [Thermoanaerobaculia bacterium]
MKRVLLPLFAAAMLAACASTKPAPAPAVDPVADPTVMGAVTDAADQATVEADAGAAVGRRVGRVAGMFAAVFGGPKCETLDETVARYRRTRDAFEATGAAIGLAHGATEGAKRGFEVDQRFAELHEMKGVTVFRGYPGDMIDAYVDNRALVADVRAVFTDHPGWIIDEDEASEPNRILLHIRYRG